MSNWGEPVQSYTQTSSQLPRSPRHITVDVNEIPTTKTTPNTNSSDLSVTKITITFVSIVIVLCVGLIVTLTLINVLATPESVVNTTSTSTVSSTDTSTISPYLNPSLTGQYWDTNGIAAVSQAGSINDIYIKNNVLYADYGTSGTVYQITSSLSSTSYPYSVTIIKTTTNPCGLIIDSQGYAYTIVKTMNYVIKYLISSPTSHQIIAGTGFASSGLTDLDGAMSLAFDSTESNIYVSDSNNHRVLMFSVNSVSGTNGQVVAGGMGQGNSMFELNYPQGIYYDKIEDYLYIANSGSHIITRWSPGASSGTIIIGTPGSFGVTTTQLRKPYWVTMDSFRNLYVTDNGNSRVMFYSAGAYNNSGTSGIAVLSMLYNPRAIVFDSSMNIYINDGIVATGRIWKYKKL